ncbi:MAG: arylsulfatase [Bryobacterales bacterium]|nr:arylsulfatase [Bryobacterales bacterium]
MAPKSNLTRRALLASLTTPLLHATDQPQPNFVILLSDDMGWQQPGFTGGKDVPTPNIDSIARDGVQLTQFYVQPVCTPTRACLLTGRYAWKTGAERRPSTASLQGMRKDERTLAEALRDAGYATWMVGKWHLGEWQSAHLPRARGFQHHYGFYGALIDSFTHTREGILDWHRNGEPVVEQGYSTFLLAAEAARLIRNHDGARPFFLYLPFNAVHGPHQAPPEYIAKYQHLGREGPQRAQLHCLDIAIGQVLQAIRDKGIDRNTIVLFTNDNGGTRLTSNGPYRGGKSAYHEGGVLTPAAVRWTGKLPAGRKSSGLIHVTDIFPTFCALAGATASKTLPLDGHDVWPVIAANAPSPRKEIVHSLQVLRQGDYKFIEQGAAYYNWTEQPLQLYNIRLDPHEKDNLAARQPALVAQLRARLQYHKQFARDEEPPERIPGFPPAVYGEEENSRHGAEIRRKLRGIAEKDAKLDRKKKKKR